MKKEISVIIVTYNSQIHIYDCLDSIFKYNDISDALEIIVVDNCSRDYNTMFKRIKDLYGDSVIVIANNKNGGYGQGNNVGIKAAISPIIMIMNPDVRLNMPIFKIVLNAFFHEKNILLYGVKQLDGELNKAKSFGWITRSCPYLSEPIRLLFCKLNIYLPNYMFLNGSCFFVRKDAFESVGLFDESIFMYNEEEDIHYRLSKIKGGKFVYNKKITCLHLHPLVLDYSSENYKWMENNLESLLYIDARDGIARNKTIKRAIQRINLSILKSLNDSKRRNYYQNWKKYLDQKINK